MRLGIHLTTLPAVPSLRVISGPLEGQSVEIDGELVIGRASGDVIIDDPELSRTHLLVRPARGALELEDLGSTNGTFVDGRRIDSPARVGNGAQIRLGETVIEVTGVVLVHGRRVISPRAANATVQRAIPGEAAAAPASAATRAGKTSATGEPGFTPAFLSSSTPSSVQRGRGLANRSWIPVAASFGSVVLTATALVIYFAAR